MKTNEKFLQSLSYMNNEMKKDTKAGKLWRYTNIKKRYARFEDARKHNRLTNCVSGVQMGMLMSGLPSATIHWYGSNGKIVYTTDKGKKAVPQYFSILKPNKTVNTLYKNNQLCDGDILVYCGMNHTNAYYGNGKSFDSGHAFCKGSGELAVFKKWIGSLRYKTSKVGVILRLKDRAHYRVQAGAYKSEAELNKQKALLQKKGVAYTIVSEDGLFKVQLGMFSGKTNAEKYAAQMKKKKIDVIVKEV